MACLSKQAEHPLVSGSGETDLYWKMNQVSSEDVNVQQVCHGEDMARLTVCESLPGKVSVQSV